MLSRPLPGPTSTPPSWVPIRSGWRSAATAPAAPSRPSRDTFAEGFLLTREDMKWFEDHYIPDGIDDADPRASMMRAEDLSGLPPAYLATCGFDPLRDEGEIYAARMREAGVQVVLQRHPSQIHGFANLTAICPSARTAKLEVAGALRMGLGLAAAPAAVPA